MISILNILLSMSNCFLKSRSLLKSTNHNHLLRSINVHSSKRLLCSRNEIELIDKTAYKLEKVNDVMELSFHNLKQKEKPFRIDFTEYLKRTSSSTSLAKNELVYKAIGKQTEVMIDLTAGLGRDGMILASCGLKVILFEKNEILYHLLQDGLHHFYNTQQQQNHNKAMNYDISLYHADSSNYETVEQILQNVTVTSTTISSDGKLVTNTSPLFNNNSSNNSNSSSDVPYNSFNISVYLDPMYPSGAVGKSALVKKETQVLHRLLGHNEGNDINNNQQLFSTAMKLTTLRVVVKRPLKSLPLLNIPPHSVIEGSTQRFDIYFKNRSIKFPSPS